MFALLFRKKSLSGSPSLVVFGKKRFYLVKYAKKCFVLLIFAEKHQANDQPACFFKDW
jgi:hypothetical protein